MGDSSATDLLAELRWDADRIITNYEGERVWLKRCAIPGDNTAVTDCCLAAAPCEYHAGLTNQANGTRN
jgi:hypothetical protein